MACCRAKVTHVEHSGVEKIPIPGALFSHVQGLPEASPWQRGPQGHRAAQAWEAEDGLCGFYGSREARGPVYCVGVNKFANENGKKSMNWT